jgi:glycosyltransferase involved in cell wall biosynthesis
MARILYITQDGITDHIGQAQIAPYLLGLSRLGHDIHIVSAEKTGRDALRARYERLFEEAGVRWTTVRYANRPPLISSFFMMRRLWRATYAVAKAERPDIVHCRSYLPLELGARLKKRLGMRFLADFRDFWADVGLETKRFKFVYRYYLAREPKLLGPADHVVTLTERAARMLMSRHPHVGGGRRASYTVIPCCADFALFDPARTSAGAAQARREQLGIDAAAPVLLYLGSLGPDYLLPRMMDLFVELRGLRPDAIFLILANNGRELVERAASERRIPPHAIRFTSSAREDVPEYMALANMAVVFIRPAQSKAGCSPTKLGELLAANVPVIANRNVGDMDLILSPEKNASIVVSDFAPATLRRALQEILAVSAEDRGRIRGMSGEFDLDEGVRRYDAIYRSLAGHEEIARPDVIPPRRQLAAFG